MAGSSFFALIDDIATLLDDVAAMTKVATKKTASVLGDDLAVNAQQVTGVSADRELPVVWAVAKGSFLNKCILVPAALAISAVVPGLIIPLLVIGGLYLCFEGAEKILHYFLHKHDDEEKHQALVDALNDDSVDIVAFEIEKIKGAIRTDFILSAEIIVIALGVVSAKPFLTQVLSLCTIAILITVGVYGLVAAIVKLDDAGIYLRNNKQGLLKSVGLTLIAIAPKLMKFLSVFGTIAMLMVGGGIITHNLEFVHHIIEPLLHNLESIPFASSVSAIALDLIIGFILGSIIIMAVSFIQKLRGKQAH